jgi:DeoR family transcriptional regulator, glycerol-3-phosphate regulon repressor
MLMNQRQREISRLIESEAYLTIDFLVEHFRVTPQTIRRDLTALEEAGLIDRYHGGAALRSSVTNTNYQTRKILHRDEKQRIAASLAELIPDGASLFINIGTTTETIAQALMRHANLRIVTNNLHVASILSAKADFRVIIAPGEVRYTDGGIVGDATRDFISQFRMDFGIIGISGIHSDGSLLDFDDREVSVARCIIQHSGQVILAADHSKFGRSAMVQLGNISQAHHLVTDAEPDEHIQSILQAHNVQLHIA